MTTTAKIAADFAVLLDEKDDKPKHPPQSPYKIFLREQMEKLDKEGSTLPLYKKVQLINKLLDE